MRWSQNIRNAWLRLSSVTVSPTRTAFERDSAHRVIIFRSAEVIKDFLTFAKFQFGSGFAGLGGSNCGMLMNFIESGADKIPGIRKGRFD